MKVLLIHSYYLLRGGEDFVFEQEFNLLSKQHEVKKMYFKNKPGLLGGVQFLFSIWNIFAAQRVKKAIREFKPDVVHLHNWNFGCGPIVVRTVYKTGIPLIITLHNYRLLCPSSSLSFKGKVFLDSIDKNFPWAAIRNGVYRNSILQTFWLSFIVWVHKKINTWKKVSKYIVLSDSSKGLFTNSSFGIAENRFIIKPNFVEQPYLEEKRNEKLTDFLYIGRLSEEKGILFLLDGFKKEKYALKIAGGGPFLKEVENASLENTKITYLGSLSSSEVKKQMQQSSVLVFPSICYETFGLVIIEAFSLGLPVIASNIGAAQGLVQHGYNGRHFMPNNIDSLQSELLHWQNLSDDDKAEYRKNALVTYKEHFTPQKNEALLISIYESVL